MTALAKGFKDLRIIAAAHALRVGFFVRKDSGMTKVADLKGKRVPYGFSAMRGLEPTVRAILATAGLTEKDIKPVMVPNVIRSADDFVSGAADAFYFAFGAPKVREVDATVGGIRMTEIDEKGMPAARKIERWGYLTQVNPGPGLCRRREADEGLQLRQPVLHRRQDQRRGRVQDDRHAGEEQSDLIAVQPVLREFSAGVRLQAVRGPLSSGRAEILQGAQHRACGAGLGPPRRATKSKGDDKPDQGGTAMPATRHLIAACIGGAALAFASGAAQAQTFGFASMQPGTINHTSSSAIAKVLKEKGGLNTLVQATAGETVMIAIVEPRRGRFRHGECSGNRHACRRTTGSRTCA